MDEHLNDHRTMEVTPLQQLWSKYVAICFHLFFFIWNVEFTLYCNSLFVGPGATSCGLTLALQHLADVGCRYTSTSFCIFNGQIATCGCTVIHNYSLAIQGLRLLATGGIYTKSGAPREVGEMIVGELSILMPNEWLIRLVGDKGLSHQPMNQFFVHLTLIEKTNTEQTASIYVLGNDSTLFQT